MTGASGLLGSALVSALKDRGASVVRLVHGPPKSPDQIHWNVAEPLAGETVSGFDAVVHLAGESIVGRWTAAKKQRIRDSRVQGTRNLAGALAQAGAKPRVFVVGSAIGYYGNRGSELLKEGSAAGSDFLADVCRQWEAAADVAAQAGIRTTHVRTGVVLSKDGGALAKMLPPFRMAVGGNMGDGHQWWSWIHIDDWVGSVLAMIGNDSLIGPVNVVAPSPVVNAEFTKILASVLHRPAIFPMPAFAARLVFGEMADGLLLASQRVEPEKMLKAGYKFKYFDLRAALESMLK
jgi:uncharacterized protein (TIGR01777 family)